MDPKLWINNDLGCKSPSRHSLSSVCRHHRHTNWLYMKGVLRRLKYWSVGWDGKTFGIYGIYRCVYFEVWANYFWLLFKLLPITLLRSYLHFLCHQIDYYASVYSTSSIHSPLYESVDDESIVVLIQSNFDPSSDATVPVFIQLSLQLWIRSSCTRKTWRIRVCLHWRKGLEETSVWILNNSRTVFDTAIHLQMDFETKFSIEDEKELIQGEEKELIQGDVTRR